MGKLIYSMMVSLDGYMEDADGGFDWGNPDDECHAFINANLAPIGTYLYGRRIYEVMSFWEPDLIPPDMPPVALEFAEIWRAADKVVFSSTLERPVGERTTIVREFEADVVRGLKEESDRDLTIEGPTLAAHAIRAGLVDEFQLFVVPVVLGGGKKFFPSGVRTDLRLLDSRTFPSGIAFQRYAVKRDDSSP